MRLARELGICPRREVDDRKVKLGVVTDTGALERGHQRRRGLVVPVTVHEDHQGGVVSGLERPRPCGEHLRRGEDLVGVRQADE